MGNKRKAYFFLKLLLSAFLVAWIVNKVNLDETIDLLFSVKLHFLLIGIFWLLLDRVLMSYRWDILLTAKQIKIPFSQIIKIYFLGTFSGNFLPSSIAPDAVRAYFASKYNSKISDILSSVLVDRVIGLFSLSIIALFSLLFIFFDKGEINLKSLWVILAIFFLITFLIFSERVLKKIPFRKLNRFLPVSNGGVVWKSLEKFYISCNEYKNNNRAIMRALFVSFVIQVLSILVVYVLSCSISLKISLIYFFIFVPLINLLIMLPVSIGGIGVQEGAFVYFFSRVGVSTHEALTVALLFRAIMVAVSLPGGVFYIIEDNPKKVLSSK